MTCYGLLAVSLRSNIPRSFEGEGLLSPLIWWWWGICLSIRPVPTALQPDWPPPGRVRRHPSTTPTGGSMYLKMRQKNYV